MVKNKIGDRLIWYQYRHDLTNKEMADKCGVCSRTYRRWKNSTGGPTLMTLFQVADGLQVTPEWLLGSDHEQTKLL